MRGPLAVVLAGVLLAGCGGGGGSIHEEMSGEAIAERVKEAVKSPTTTKASLFLDRYPLSMKEELDRYAENKQCANLQFKFDYTADSKDSLRRMYGRNGYDILQYIDDLMERAGCY